MIDIEVIDNFLDAEYIDYINHWVLNNARWHYRPNISAVTLASPDKPYMHGLSLNIHEPVRNVSFASSGTDFMIPAFIKIESTFGLPKWQSCHRARFDMTLISPENTIHDPHVDFDHPHYACILYLNDSDGDTVIYNETLRQDNYTEKMRISPKKNRLVFFNGKYWHTGHSPSKHQNRLLLNSNFDIPK